MEKKENVSGSIRAKDGVQNGIVSEDEFQRVANKVSFVTIIGNILLSVMKLIAGFVAHSNAMISDAIHSASDVFSTFVVIIGIKLASKKADKEHPYGHERLECVAAIVLSMVLFITGFGIGTAALKNITSGDYNNIVVPGILALVASIILAILLGVTGVGIGLTGVQKLTAGHYDTLAVPGVLALAAAVISIVVKEIMYWYTRNAAKKINSGALMADAWHHRSDAFSSIGALIGIAGARLGFPIMDSIASLIIFVFIIKAAYDIFKDAIDKMVDHACDDDTVNQIRECVMKHEDVLGIDMLQTRIFGNKIYVDLEIATDGSYTLSKAHTIAESVHDDIEKSFPKVKHIMVHVNPADV